MAPPSRGAEIPITGITDNSQKTESGNIFVATRGATKDSHVFISDAAEHGARVVVCEQDISDYGEGCCVVRVSDSREALGRLAHAFYGNPTRKMLVFGVTGTNGKTTSTYLLESILRAAGFRPGVVGTIEYRFAGKSIKAVNTTPSALQLAQLFADMWYIIDLI